MGFSRSELLRRIDARDWLHMLASDCSIAYKAKVGTNTASAKGGGPVVRVQVVYPRSNDRAAQYI